MSEKCPKCGKSVYEAEKKLAAGKSWHKMCLKCGMCNKLLDSTTVAEHEGEVFCKQCHGRKFGTKGYGFGGGSGCLNMDTGENKGIRDIDTSGKAKDGMGGKIVPPEEGGCPRCGKRVYDAEKAIGCPDGLKFHKACFRCKDCSKAVDSTNLCTEKASKEVYCKTCYGKSFGPKGFGFGQGAGALNMG
ncbi:Cysteine and glycine-rich protein 1 [Cichlidogyrus casuarinus]|uniref:Cysteine and glycine-rich protein 1 n=1 Tax=Cichlidogyrus casuarinus TaxID=1844966 RepID=A0ABD2PJ80_9PLAT